MRPLFTVLMLAFATACGADEEPSVRQGAEGASCLKTNDCLSPLQCFGNVCRGEARTIADVAQFDDVSRRNADIALWDSAEFDSETTTDPPSSPDSVVAEDTPRVTADTVDVTAGPSDVLNPIGDCEELGVAAEWSGDFDGDIDYDLGVEIPGLVRKDILPVEGSLNFSIQCIEAKLVVLGEMDGVALGLNPFTLTLQGTFSPSTGQLTAQMVDGVVDIFGLVQVYFEGDFDGQLVDDGQFSGLWDGEATGNSAELDAVAIGTGTWLATPSDSN